MSVCEQREAWLLARQRGLGGSDMAAVVGLSPFKRPIDIFIGKTQETQFSPDIAEHIQWGNLLEPVIRAEYARRAQTEIVSGLEIADFFPGRSAPWEAQTIVRSSDSDWMLGTPDGIIPKFRRGLEIKNSAYKGEGWGQPGSDEIPDHYAIQCQWYMAVTERPEWDVAVLFSGNRLEVYRLLANAELQRELISAGRAFWHDNVLRNIAPAIDESESYARYLSRKYSLASGDALEADESITGWAQQLATAQQDRKDAEARELLAENNLADLLGSHPKSVGSFGSVNWVRPKQGSRINWEAVATALNPSSELIAANTSPVHNTPYIRLYPAKEK